MPGCPDSIQVGLSDGGVGDLWLSPNQTQGIGITSDATILSTQALAEALNNDIRNDSQTLAGGLCEARPLR